MGTLQHINAEQAKLFFNLFRGRTDCYGTFDPDTGSDARQVKRAPSVGIYRAHLEGKYPIGIYPLVNGRCWFAAVDVDDGDLGAAQNILARAKHYALPGYLERSKQKGFHCWWFFMGDEGVSAAKVRVVFRHILMEAQAERNRDGKPREIFPKQAAASWGNYINLPLFGRFAAEGRMVFVDPASGIPLPDPWDLLRGVQRIPEAVLDEIIDTNSLCPSELRNERVQEAPSPHGVDKRAIVDAIAPYWIPQRRHDLALALSGWLAKSGVAHSVAEEIIREVATRADDPELGDRVRAVADTYQKSASGNQLRGWDGLTELLPEDVLATLQTAIESRDELPRQWQIPAGWAIEDKTHRPGLYKVKARAVDGKVENEYILVAHSPVLLVKQLRDTDTGDLYATLTWRDERDWQDITLPRGQVYNRHQLVSAAARGAPVNSENTSDIVKFLAAFEDLNRAKLKPERAAARLGWIQAEKLFLAGETAIGGEATFLPQATEDASLARAYAASGDYDVWLKLAKRVRQDYPLARFVVASAFAAPLMRLAGLRTALLYLFGETRIGKTAVATLAASVWGDPTDLRASFYSTKVGLERLAALYSDLLLVVDERQAAQSPELAQGLVYMLAGERGKVRGHRAGGLQASGRWRTLIVMTGEEDLASMVGWSGTKTRALEIHMDRLLPEEVAAEIYHTVAKHHGHAGLRFVKAIIEDNMWRGLLRTEFEQMQSVLTKRHPHALRPHVCIAALVATADVLSARIVFAEEIVSAERAAQAAAEVALGSIVADAGQSYAEQALEFAESWAYEQDQQKRGTVVREPGRLYLSAAAFENALKDRGYSPRRVLADWGRLGWIETASRGGKLRYKVRKTVGEGRGHFVGLTMDIIERKVSESVE